MAEKTERLVVAQPRMEIARFDIVGTAPYVQHKFSEKSKKQMLDAHAEGSRAKSKKKRESRDVDAEYKGAMHLMPDGSYGIPAPAFRSAMISACRLIDYQMTRAKLSVFIEADGFDAEDGTPLVKLNGEPRMHQAHVRLASGVASIAVRPMWHKWSASVNVRFDLDQFSPTDVANLLMRAGAQVGIGEGRPDSKKSHGMGWGLFEIVGSEEAAA